MSVNRTTVPVRTILTKMSANASVATTHMYGVNRTTCMTMTPVDVCAKRPVLHPMNWTQKPVNACAIKSAHQDIY